MGDWASLGYIIPLLVLAWMGALPRPHRKILRTVFTFVILFLFVSNWIKGARQKEALDWCDAGFKEMYACHLRGDYECKSLGRDIVNSIVDMSRNCDNSMYPDVRQFLRENKENFLEAAKK